MTIPGLFGLFLLSTKQHVGFQISSFLAYVQIILKRLSSILDVIMVHNFSIIRSFLYSFLNVSFNNRLVLVHLLKMEGLNASIDNCCLLLELYNFNPVCLLSFGGNVFLLQPFILIVYHLLF